MDAYLYSLIVFAIAANIIALPLILLGRKFDLRCHPIEYMMIYLIWAVFVALVGGVFDDLNHAMLELQVSDTAFRAIFAVAGVFGGLSLLPKVLLSGQKLSNLLITSASSILVTILFSKFAVLVFLFTGDS